MRLAILTRGALSVAIIYVCFLMFKGALNILNALFVPLILYLVTLKASKKETLTLYAMVLLFCFLFINIQLFFVLFYCIIAGVLTVLHKHISSKIISWVLLTLTIGICFWLGIRMTDLVFHTQINHIMLNILHNNRFLYFIMIVVEAGIVSSLLLVMSNIFHSRVILANKY